jgi:hypothetical protein
MLSRHFVNCDLGYIVIVAQFEDIRAGIDTEAAGGTGVLYGHFHLQSPFKSTIYY